MRALSCCDSSFEGISRPFGLKKQIFSSVMPFWWLKSRKTKKEIEFWSLEGRCFCRDLYRWRGIQGMPLLGRDQKGWTLTTLNSPAFPSRSQELPVKPRRPAASTTSTSHGTVARGGAGRPATSGFCRPPHHQHTLMCSQNTAGELSLNCDKNKSNKQTEAASLSCNWCFARAVESYLTWGDNRSAGELSSAV